MDFEFGGFDSESFGDFEAELEEFRVTKVRKMDRHLRTGEGGSILATPRLHEGIVYFGSADNYIYAVDIETGKEIWRFRTEGKIFSTPAVHGDKVFIGSYDKNLYALFNHGEEAWRFKTGGEINTSPFVHGERVFIGSNDGYFYSIDVNDGKEIWRFRTGDWIGSSPTVSGGRIYFGSYDGYIYCLSLEGKELWRFRMGAEIWALHESPRIWKGVCYFASMDGYLYAVDAETGKEIWRVMTAGKYGNAIQPFVNDDFVLQPNREGTLFAFDKNGKELWRFEHGTLPAGIGIHGGRIYMGNEDGVFWCLSLEGKVIWRFKTGSKIFGGPLFWKDRIVFPSYDCHLYSLNPEGEEIWRFATSNSQPVSRPPPHDAFKVEVKKNEKVEETGSEDSYKSRKEDSVSISDYQIENEYASTSDYKAKSDYDVNMVIFEGEFLHFRGLDFEHQEVVQDITNLSTFR